MMATTGITDTEENSQLSYRTPVQAAPTPSLPVKVNSDPPAIRDRAPSIILVLDSEEGVVPTTFIIKYSQMPAQLFGHCQAFL